MSDAVLTNMVFQLRDEVSKLRAEVAELKAKVEASPPRKACNDLYHAFETNGHGWPGTICECGQRRLGYSVEHPARWFMGAGEPVNE